MALALPEGTNSLCLLYEQLWEEKLHTIYKLLSSGWLWSVFRIRIQIQGCFGSGFQIWLRIQVFKNDYDDYDYDDYDDYNFNYDYDYDYDYDYG